MAAAGKSSRYGHRDATDPDRLSPPTACGRPSCAIRNGRRLSWPPGVRNAKQAPENSENNRRIGAAPVGRRTYALPRCEFREAAQRYAEDSKGPLSVYAAGTGLPAPSWAESRRACQGADPSIPRQVDCALEVFDACQGEDVGLGCGTA